MLSPSATSQPVQLPTNAFLASSVCRGLGPLVPERARAKFAKAFSRFTVPVYTAGFECRLAARDERIDFGMCLFPSEAANTARFELPTRPEDEDVWARWWSVYLEWAGTPLLQLEVPFLWVSLDTEHLESAIPLPGLGLSADPMFLRHQLVPGNASDLGSEHVRRIVQRYGPALGQRLPPAATERIDRILSYPDSVVAARQCSFMLGRSPATFKFDVRLEAAHLGSFLEWIDWPRAEEHHAMFAELYPWETPIQLNLVLHPHTTGPLEVEMMTTSTPNQQRAEFLERLQRRGLCSGEKARCLLDLMARGTSPATHNAEMFQIGYAWYAKVRFGQGGPIQAKAYVGMMARHARGLSNRVGEA